MSTFHWDQIKLPADSQHSLVPAADTPRREKPRTSALTENSRLRKPGETFKHKQERYLSIIQSLSKRVDEQKQYLDKAQVILLVMDTDGKVTHINAKGCQILGYPRKEIIGKNWFENFIPPRIKGELFPLTKLLMHANINEVAYHENPVLTRSGEERLIAWYNTVIKDDRGNVVGFYSAGVDITGRAREEKNRRKLAQPSPETPLTPLQGKYIRTGVSQLNDREKIEIILSLTMPADTAARLAQTSIEKYKNLRGFLAAPALQLQRLGIPRNSVLAIKLVHDLPAQILKEEIMNRPAYNSPRDFYDYLNVSMRDLDKEVFKVIYLNARNQIIEITDLFKGTSDRIDFSSREIVESALENGTKSLIFAHNHPSGDPIPSNSDKGLTRELVFIGKIMGIKVLDHIVIGDNKYYSFAGEGLIDEYEIDFLNLMLRGTTEARKKMYQAREPGGKGKD